MLPNDNHHRDRGSSPRPKGLIEKQIDVVVDGLTYGGDSSSTCKAYVRSIVEKRPRHDPVGGLQVQTHLQTVGAAHEERDSEQDEREVGYSPRVKEAPTGKKSHKERLTTTKTRLDVLEASLEELY
ncbi:hypothetical protein GW17_00035359 [Ensete ventricosum]|nr:hypothetical protein GW17_00035359 [Ensete ventricosum]